MYLFSYLIVLTASWRIFQFSMHQHSPAVTRLQLHLPNQQRILFDPTKTSNHQILQKLNTYKTSLTEFFVACSNYTDAQTLTYPNMPSKFVWDKASKVWKPRLCYPASKAFGWNKSCRPITGSSFIFARFVRMLAAPSVARHRGAFIATIGGHSLICPGIRLRSAYM